MTRGWIAFTASLLAIFAGGALFVSSFTVSMYSDGGTLYGDNGPGVLIPVVLPLVFAVVAFAGLSARCTGGSVFGERSAIVSLALLTVFTVLTGFSIGILVLPITALVAVAVVLTPGQYSDHVFDDVE